MGILGLSTVIILQCLCCSSLANTSLIGIFIEIPSSVTIEVENGVEVDALFRCRHQRIDAAISWLINGTSSRINNDAVDSFIRDSNDIRIDTLTIPAIPEYNGIEVVCVATFFDGSPRREVTPPANLTIFIINEVAPEITTQPPPTTTMEPVAPETTTQSPPTTTMDILTMKPVTPEAATQPPPTTTMEPGFVMTPSSLNKTVEQGEALFRCQHRSSDGIIWTVNGTSITSFDNIPTLKVNPFGKGHFLSIATLPGFNNTTIECGAIFRRNSSLLFTPPVTLLIQGIPGNVSNLGFERNYSSGTLTTFWDPLPTLDITDRDPDIIYRVQIFQTTCRENVLMSDENVTESITSNSLSPLELMEIYTAVITPRNNVPGYVDGPKREMKEKFMSLNGMTLFELSRGWPKTIESIQPVPHYYTMMLEPLDDIGSNLRVNISVQRDGEMVTMQTGEPLPSKCLWSASILPYNCEMDMPMAELSTHEIQNVVVTVNSSRPGAIHLKGNFVDGSEATGVLWMVCSLNNDSDIQYVYIAKQPEQSSISMDVTGLTGTEYGVSVFALENGVPFHRVVTLPTNLTVTAADNDDRETVSQPLMSIDPTSTGVCITCTFLESSATDCVAVVHQRISQLNSSGLMNIEKSHKLNKFGDTAYECIEVDMEQYQVGVIAVKVISPTIQSNDKGSSLSGAIAGIVLGITTFILIAVVMIGIVYYYLRKRPKFGPLYSEVGIVPNHLQSDTVVNIEDDSGFHHYAESAVPLREEDTNAEEQSSPLPPGLEESLVAPPLPPRSEESMILVEDQVLDSARSPLETIKERDRPPPPPPPPPRGSPDQDTSKDKDGSSDPTYAQPELTRKVAVPPPGPPDPPAKDSSKDGSSDPTYAQPELTSKVAVPPPGPSAEDSSKDGSSAPTYAQPELTRKVAVPPPAATERLVYDDVHAFQNKEGNTYAMTQLPASKKVVDDLHKVVYSEIQPKTAGEGTCTEPDCTAEQTCETGTPPSPRDSPTADLFFSRLLPYASKWQSLGLAMSLDDDRLDEIFTNNERDEACLQEMLELYMMRSDHNHSWEEIEAALKRIGNDFQESDSLTISPMIHVHGSTTFSSDVTTNPQRRSPSHNILNVHDAKTRYNRGTSAVPGRKWSSFPDISAEVADSEEYGIDYDFKSEPNIPYSQGSFTVNDNPQCTVAYNLKEDELTVSATDIDDVDRRDKLIPSSPSFLGGHFCYAGSFIINKGYEEELFDAELQLCIPQKSYLELTEYDRALIKQLGLGQQNPSTKNHCQESSEELNIDVHAGTASQLVPQLSFKHFNTTSSSQDMLSSLKKLPVHKAKYSSQELQLVMQVTELTANHKLWTIWRQVDEWLDVCSQVCSLIRKSACGMLQSFSSFMPLEYPT